VVLNHSKDGGGSPSTFLVNLHSKTFIFLLVFGGQLGSTEFRL
jgi:hypothetical protein